MALDPTTCSSCKHEAGATHTTSSTCNHEAGTPHATAGAGNHPKSSTSIVFTGDIGFDRYMDKRWEDPNLLAQPVLAFFHSADHTVANVEGALIDAVDDGSRGVWIRRRRASSKPCTQISGALAITTRWTRASRVCGARSSARRRSGRGRWVRA